MGIKVIVISRGRSSTIAGNTCRILPSWVDVYVPESEVGDYAVEVENRLVPVPDDVEGLGRLRNWALDNVSEETVIMVDDDMSHVYEITGEKARRIEDPDEIIQIIVNNAICAKDAGCGVFGFTQTDIRKYSGTDPFSLTGWVGGIIGVIGREIKFRNDYFKVDIDFCMKNMQQNRIIWMDNRYMFVQKRDNNAGGNALFRTSDAYERSIDSLVKKWGKYIKVRRVKNQYNIRTNVGRKQAISYE